MAEPESQRQSQILAAFSKFAVDLRHPFVVLRQGPLDLLPFASQSHRFAGCAAVLFGLVLLFCPADSVVAANLALAESFEGQLQVAKSISAVHKSQLECQVDCRRP